jgi:zinc protease
MTMRSSTVVILIAGFLTVGCPGRDTTPPETGGGTAAGSAVRRVAGLASFTGEMLRRGAGSRTAKQISEDIEFVGGSLDVRTEPDSTSIQVRVLRDHLDLAMSLMADLAQRPTFAQPEIEIIRQRELDRLTLMQSQPHWLARQAFYRALYGPDHPYGYADAEPQVIERLTRDQLVAFHRQHYIPRNAFLLVVGDTDPAAVEAVAQRTFGAWEDRPVPDRSIPRPPPAPAVGRRVVVVDRPGTTQAQIYIGNVALERAHPAHTRLRVANQILGGSASARLFMNLRERCSYSYGVYSNISNRAGPGPHIVGGAVEIQHTAGALREVFGELDRIRGEPPPAEELRAAQDYLVGQFPIMTETAANLAELVSIQRVFGLPDDYWSTLRSAIAGVTADQVTEVARTFIRPEDDLVVIVGDASVVAEPASHFGAVTVVDLLGRPIGTREAAPDQWPGGEPPECPALPDAGEAGPAQEPPAPSVARDIDFPAVHESVLGNGLEVLTVEQHDLPLVELRLVIRSGSGADPAM